MTKSNPSKLPLAASLIVLGALLAFSRQNTSTLSFTFAQEPVEIQGFSQGEGSVENSPSRILIPELSIDLEVLASEIRGGYWLVHENSAGWGVGSGLPGDIGNQVIFAHARDGLFLPLKDIEVDMAIYVFTKDSWYRYKVSNIGEAYPHQTEVIKPSDDERLTLYTCSGYKDTKRLIVTATRDL